jgi:nucleoside-diphosphate-sugar epimerase
MRRRDGTLKYLVTGATGFIGGRVTRMLREAGHDVVALVRSPDAATGLSALGVELAAGDITDRESMRQPMQGVDGVFHLAAWYKIGARDRSMAWRINVAGTRNVVEMMREVGVPKGVYTSTLAVFSDTHGKVVDEYYLFEGRHLSDYDRTKWEAHYGVAGPQMAAGLPLVIVQPGLNYGPGDTSSVRGVLVDYLNGRLPAAPAVTAYCWAHVDDTARGHLLAMEKGRVGESYIIAGPVHRFTEAFDMAERITGVRAPRLRPSPWMMRMSSRMMSVVERVAPVPENYSSETLRVTAGVTYLGSSAKAERELGFRARPLEEGLRETLEYEQKLIRA